MLDKFVNWFLNADPAVVFRFFLKVWICWAILIVLTVLVVVVKVVLCCIS